MIIPELIHIEKDKEIADFVFDDLELSRILSQSDFSFLKWPCKENEIRARQGIFRAMEKETFRSALVQCQNAINDYEKWKMLIRDSANEVEKHYLCVRVLENYLSICKIFRKLYGYCGAVDKVVAFLMSEDQVKEQSNIRTNVAEMKKILLKISKCSISFMTQGYMQKEHIASSYIDKINHCAKALQLTVPSIDSAVISFDGVLADAFMQLYHDDFSCLNDIEASCDEPLNCDFSNTKAEIDFILHIWALVQKAAAAGIPYTFPLVSGVKELRIDQAYCISLLSKTTEIVPNDVRLDEDAPFCFLTGANGGGKTEYLRTIGVNLLLFLSGCPIFAESGWIYPFTFVSSHFPKDERYGNVGRLEDEKLRVRQMLENADAESVLLFNETFSGTDETLGSALLLQTAEYLLNNKIFGLAVTHLHGVDTGKYTVLCPEVIDMPNDSGKRTYRIVKKTNATGSYAEDILSKYKLDRKSLRARKAMIDG